MSDWGRRTYGDPCRECGFGWELSIDDGVARIAMIPESYEELIGASDGSHRGAGLDWSSLEYVCHVTDNLRIWAERLAAAALNVHDALHHAWDIERIEHDRG